MFPLGCRAFFRQRCVSARLSRFLQAAVCFRLVVRSVCFRSGSGMFPLGMFPLGCVPLGVGVTAADLTRSVLADAHERALK